MTQLLFHRLADIAERVRRARHTFLFLDFDGTLSPIVNEPAAASMPNDTKRCLEDLFRSERFSLSIVSGRGLRDLRQRVELEGIVYAGDYGFAISGAGLHFVHPRALERVHRLRELIYFLEQRLRGICGLQFEYKWLTASIHYRKVREGEREALHAIVEQAVASAGGLFGMAHAPESIVIRPRTNWHKGSAANYILQATGRNDALPIYIGDDATDEDAFIALEGGVTIKVGLTTSTAAHYQLEHQNAVTPFLSWLVDLDGACSEEIEMRGKAR